MKRYIPIIFFLAVAASLPSESSGQQTFFKEYGIEFAFFEDESNVAMSVQDSFIYLLSPHRITETDNNGNMIWSFHDLSITNFGLFVKSSDGIYVVGCDTLINSIATDKNFLFYKLDFSGNIVWSKKYWSFNNSVHNFWGTHIFFRPDNTFLIRAHADADDRLIDVDTAGNLNWHIDCGDLSGVTTHPDAGQYALTDDGGIIYSGTQYSETPDSDFVMAVEKINNMGVRVSKKIFSDIALRGSSNYMTCKTYDNKFVFFGKNTQALPAFLTLTKLDSSIGNIEWSRKYILPFPYSFAAARHIIKTNDDGFMCVATIGTASGNERNMLAVKLDSVGSEQWNKVFYMMDSSSLMGISVHSADSCYYFLGVIDSMGNDFLSLIKTDTLGRFDCNVDSSITLSSNLIYPIPNSFGFGDIPEFFVSGNSMLNFDSQFSNLKNYCIGEGIAEPLKIDVRISIIPDPSTAQTMFSIRIPTLNINSRTDNGTFLMLFDMHGKQFQKLSLQTGMNNLTLDVSSLSSGEYLAVISIDGHNAGGKKFGVVH